MSFSLYSLVHIHTLIFASMHAHPEFGIFPVSEDAVESPDSEFQAHIPWGTESLSMPLFSQSSQGNTMGPE